MRVAPGALREVAAQIARVLGEPLEPRPAQTLHGGGGGGESYRWQSGAGPLFVKLAPASRAGMLAAEAEGLEALSRASAVRVPAVRAVGATAACGYLALEWLTLCAPGAAAAGALGARLALQHRVTSNAFGWHRDNTIGATPQHNQPLADWAEFFRERRLGVQLTLAAGNGHTGRLQSTGRRLLDGLDERLAGHRPAASLLHGDLWGGNWAADAAGLPVLYDPAVYFGDRETDIAMTRLFGGFDANFYAAYDSAWPPADGAERRAPLYDLYHVLNHLNLFGGGYLARAQALIDGLLESP